MQEWRTIYIPETQRVAHVLSVFSIVAFACRSRNNSASHHKGMRQLRRRESFPGTKRVESRPMRAAHDALEAAAVLDLTCASTFLPGVPAIISNGVDDRWSWVRCVLVGPVVIGGVRSYFLNTVITVQHRLDNGTTVLYSVPGASVPGEIPMDANKAIGS